MSQLNVFSWKSRNLNLAAYLTELEKGVNVYDSHNTEATLKEFNSVKAN